MTRKIHIYCFFMFSVTLFAQYNTSQLKIYLGNDELDKAEKEMAIIFKKDTTSLEYLLFSARLEWKRGNYLTSSKYYLRCMPLDSSKACNGMAILHAINSDYKIALIYINSAIRLDSKTPDYFTTRGNIYYSISNYDSALADYGKALSLDSLDDHAFYNMGLTYNSLSKYELAIINYNKSILLRPINFKAYFERGLSKLYNKEFESAINDFRGSLKYRNYVNHSEWVSEGSVYHYIAEAYYYLDKKYKFKKYNRKAKRKGWKGSREDLL